MKKIRMLVWGATLATIILPVASLAQPTVKPKKEVFAPDEAIVVEYSNPNGHIWDVVGVARPSEGDQTSIGGDLGGKWSSKIGDQKSGDKTFSGLPEGKYEARYISWDGGNNRTTARVSFAVGNAPPPPPPPVTPPVTPPVPPVTPPVPPVTPPTTGGTTRISEKTIEIEVPANKAWTATGVKLNADDYVRIQASGNVEASQPADTRVFYHNVPPEGRDEFIPNEPYPLLRGLCLVGKIGEAGHVLPVEKYVHILRAGDTYGTGELFLGINDDGLDDNSGAWKVRLTVFTRTTTAAGPPPTTTPPTSERAPDSVTIKLNKTHYEVNEPVLIEYSGPPGRAMDTILVALPADGVDSPAVQKNVWNVGGKLKSSFTASGLPQGKYEVRYRSQILNTGAKPFITTRVPFTVGAEPAEGLAKISTAAVSPSVQIEKTSFLPGEKIQVRFTAPATYPTGAWIGVIPSDVPHGSSTVNDQHDVAYQFLDRRTNDVIAFEAPMERWGKYDLRMNDAFGSGSEVASVSFTVGISGMNAGAPSLRLDKASFKPGEEIKAHFTTPTTYPDNAWVGIIPSSVPHGEEAVNDSNQLAYFRLYKSSAGTRVFKAPEKSGSYDLRLNDTDDNGKEVASVTFTVDSSAAATGSPVTSNTSTPASGPAAAVNSSFTGAWETTWGDMTLKQEGDHVAGTYTHPWHTGTLDGTVKDSVLRFKWTQNNRPEGGTGQLTMAADGKTFSGGYNNLKTNYADISAGAWTGKRK